MGGDVLGGRLFMDQVLVPPDSFLMASTPYIFGQSETYLLAIRITHSEAQLEPCFWTAKYHLTGLPADEAHCLHPVFKAG